MASFKSFEDIDAWQRARRLSHRIFEVTNIGAFGRDFVLRDQINRASGSVMDNISEGFERGGNREFIQSLAISKGSTGEVRSQLYRALDRKYITPQDFANLRDEIIEIAKMIGALMKYLAQSEFKGSKYKHRTDL
jgi:four helix bundle protein